MEERARGKQGDQKEGLNPKISVQGTIVSKIKAAVVTCGTHVYHAGTFVYEMESRGLEGLPKEWKCPQGSQVGPGLALQPGHKCLRSDQSCDDESCRGDSTDVRGLSGIVGPEVALVSVRPWVVDGQCGMCLAYVPLLLV